MEKKKASGAPSRFLSMMRNMAAARWKLAVIMTVVVLTAIVTAVAVMRCGSSEEKRPEIVIEETPIQIEDIRPKGELYVCTSLVEDYTIERRTEMHLGILPEKHSCIQILRQKISYRIDLDKVRYIPDTLNVMIVEMPPVEYTASTQSSPFLSDDEDYWIKELPNTNGLKAKVERQIRRRFDTDANRKKAERYAEEALSELLDKLGYEARFKPRVERKRE
ncbi:MAG: hypothetical protein LUD00_03825 [Prevotellaceae bacterium]|nr:hypothetical protein [Prevotellaceae bacterium]